MFLPQQQELTQTICSWPVFFRWLMLQRMVFLTNPCWLQWTSVMRFCKLTKSTQSNVNCRDASMSSSRIFQDKDWEHDLGIGTSETTWRKSFSTSFAIILHLITYMTTFQWTIGFPKLKDWHVLIYFNIDGVIPLSWGFTAMGIVKFDQATNRDFINGMWHSMWRRLGSKPI